MRKPVVVITGAGGEIGHGLIDRLAQQGDRRIVTIDVSRLDETIAKKVDREITGTLLEELAQLSTSSATVSLSSSASQASPTPSWSLST